MHWMCTTGVHGGREGEELRMLNIYDTLAGLTSYLFDEIRCICVRMRGAEGDLEQV